MREEPAAAALRGIIAARGGVTVAQYMALCLTDPEHGYYRRRAAIGAAGDFVTAPEISQVFGEVLGGWCLAVWEAMGRPQQHRLAELGPGRGTLAADVLRTLKVRPACLSGLTLDLVEVDGAQQALQQQRLAGMALPVRWSPALAVQNLPTVLLANEFLDALPVQQFVLTNGQWHERCVVAGAGGALTFAAGAPAEPPQPLLARLSQPVEGAILEVRDTGPLLGALAAQAARAPLAALFIDYGHRRSGYADTLQAVRDHAYVPPLEAPGAADLTTQVDFAAFADSAAAHGLCISTVMDQGAFLAALGALERGAQLARQADARTRSALELGLARLISPDAMGERFKVIALTSSGVAVPLPPMP